MKHFIIYQGKFKMKIDRYIRRQKIDLNYLQPLWFCHEKPPSEVSNNRLTTEWTPNLPQEFLFETRLR